MVSPKFRSMDAPITSEKKRKGNHAPFSVTQMLVALELGIADDAVLQYLDFFTGVVPVRKVQVLHVVPTFDMFQILYEREADSVIGNLEFNQEIVNEIANRIKKRPLEQQSKVAFDVREGNPLEQLLLETEESEADLVVIGQRTGTTEHGILARNLARKATGNVLIVPEGAAASLRTIVVPIDFSPYSVKALETAIAIRRALPEPVRILCVNVYELPNLNIYLVDKLEDIRRIVQEDRKAAFRTFLSRFAPEDIESIETDVVERDFSSVSSYILEFATGKSADLIIAGAKGHSRVERLLLGSVTEKLLAINERIPVMVVR